MELKTFYVTFGFGTIFRNYHAVIEAINQDIVHAFMNKNYGRIWSSCYTEEPKHSKALQEKPEKLYYSEAEHV